MKILVIVSILKLLIPLQFQCNNEYCQSLFILLCKINIKITPRILPSMEPDQQISSPTCSNRSDCQPHISGDYHDPLVFSNWGQFRKECQRKLCVQLNANSFQTLFSQQEILVTKQNMENMQQYDTKQQVKHSKILHGIIKKSKKNQINSQQENRAVNKKDIIQEFNFGFSPETLSFHETPMYKTLIQTPFIKFTEKNKSKIILLKQKINSNLKIVQLALSTNPMQYIQQGSVYFRGLALNMKSKLEPSYQLLFNKLACFLEPFNQETWWCYFDSLKNYCQFETAFYVSKTAFLFTKNPEFGLQYLSLGDKCKIPMHELRGLLSYFDNPQMHDKIIYESTKLQMKNRKLWRGLEVLINVCYLNDFKPSTSQFIILACKNLQNIGLRNYSLRLLRKAFDKLLSTLEAFQIYFEMLIRQKQGKLTQVDFSHLEKISQFISQQARFKFTLSIAQFYKNDIGIFEKWIHKSYQFIIKYCKQGLGKKRALRHLYFTVLRCKQIIPPSQITCQYSKDNNMIFQVNRIKYIQGNALENFEFSEWKYYLHYSLVNNIKMLEQGISKWPQIGRLTAELIHILRMYYEPNKVLQFWRVKIEQIPKSGQLWCEGGRIYLQLSQFKNAMKCFQAAIHFTPQFGDSFFELMKVHLIKRNFKEIWHLKNKYLICEPIYGSISTFWKYSGQTYGYPILSKLSPRETWNLARKQIEASSYKNRSFMAEKQEKIHTLTASERFNQIRLNPPTSIFLREKLFMCFEQFDKKS